MSYNVLISFSYYLTNSRYFYIQWFIHFNVGVSPHPQSLQIVLRHMDHCVGLCGFKPPTLPANQVTLAKACISASVFLCVNGAQWTQFWREELWSCNLVETDEILRPLKLPTSLGCNSALWLNYGASMSVCVQKGELTNLCRKYWLVAMQGRLALVAVVTLACMRRTQGMIN